MKKYLFLIALVILSVSGLRAQTPVVYGYIQNWVSVEQRPHSVYGPVSPGSKDTIQQVKTTGNDLMYAFRLRRAVVGAKADINDIFSVTANADFAADTKIGLDFFANAKVNNYLYFKLGQYVPTTQVWEGSRSSSELKFYDYADIAAKSANYMNLDGYRDMGLQIGGSYDMFDYSVYVGNGLGKYSFSSGVQERRVGQGFYGVRIDAKPMKGLRIGGHFSMNKQDSLKYNNNYYNLDRNSYSIGFESQNLILPGLILQGDFAGGKVNDLARMVAGNYTLYGSERTFKYTGASVVLGYKVTKNLHLLGRYDFFNESYDPIAKDSTISKADIKLSKIAAGAVYYFFNEDKEIFKVGFNYHVRNESPDYLYVNNTKQSLYNVDDNIFCIFTQIKF